MWQLVRSWLCVSCVDPSSLHEGMYFIVHISWTVFPYHSTYSSWLTNNFSTHSTSPIKQPDTSFGMTLVFLVLLRWKYILYTFTLIIIDCVSIITYLSYRELLACLILLLTKLHHYPEHPSRRFLLPDSMFHGYCQQLYWLTFVALLWFPPVGLTQYSDPLRRVITLLFVSWLLCSWTILKISYVATYSATLYYPLLVRLNLKVNLPLDISLP
jgi:hypothetical protein